MACLDCRVAGDRPGGLVGSPVRSASSGAATTTRATPAGTRRQPRLSTGDPRRRRRASEDARAVGSRPAPTRRRDASPPRGRRRHPVTEATTTTWLAGARLDETVAALRPDYRAVLVVADGLPRIDRRTDTYNAVSVAHVLPVGGEDLDRYEGSLHLPREAGDEPFETTADGRALIDHPETGEVVWRDDAGVTCRRWNWRQCTRTRLTHATRRAVFVLDALGPMTDGALEAAA